MTSSVMLEGHRKPSFATLRLETIIARDCRLIQANLRSADCGGRGASVKGIQRRGSANLCDGAAETTIEKERRLPGPDRRHISLLTAWW